MVEGKEYPRIAEEMLRQLFGDSLAERSEEEREILKKGAETIAAMGTRECLPAPNAITLELLSNTPDDELLDMLWLYLCAFLHRCPAARYDAMLASLPHGLLTFYHVMSIEGEVHNGGFWQFFYNSSGQYAQETLRALREIAAHRRAALLESAIRLWEAVGRPADSRARWFGERADEKAEDELTNKYFELAPLDPAETSIEPFGELVIRYIREHPEGFLHQRTGDD